MTLRTDIAARSVAAKAPEIPATVLKERRALLQRVLWSRQVERYGRIRDLLVYVCERALEDPLVEIHEQEIGYRVFGRPRDYDTSADNIVRVTASQARKKLEQYFESEGRAEPILLEIPKGQYTPVFRERSPLPAVVTATPEPTDSRAPILRGTAVVLVFLVIVLAALLLVQSRRLRVEQSAALTILQKQPALDSLWSQILTSSGRTDIVVSDSSLSLFEELRDRQLTLAEYLQPGHWSLPPAVESDSRLRAFAELAAQRGFTSMASVTAAFRIAQLAGRNQNLVSMLRARDFNMTQMKFDNVILLGSSRANPWQYLLEDHLNFRYGYDQQTRYSYFENRTPHPGELAFYRMAPNLSYCRIAFLPNLAGTGNVLSIAGTEIEGTEGGGDFITSERSVAKLISVLGLSPGTPMPHFELLLQSNRVGGQTAGLTIVAYRILRP